MEPLSRSRERSIAEVFNFIDSQGVGGLTAEVALRLTSGAYLTVRGGGPGVLSSPSAGPFTDYEVMVDHDPPRFWSRYSQDELGSLFAHVPALLIAHHITRHGRGIEAADPALTRREVTATLDLHLTLPAGMRESVLAAVSALSGVSVMTSSFSALPGVHINA